ncbi:hypothetical protein PHMEG_0003803 [Phytophthora megakarya]|uniref:ISXO2-like transposase domain-containing protein n=1 Tax=Phytophthora megakarya TaxID=4795 RepID=A0A225WVG0_9STRA|nr:hypothetical protein PHMEG_0003803 [Phytophthora megakarya]
MNSNAMLTLPSPYLYHLSDEGLFTMVKVLEATANENFCDLSTGKSLFCCVSAPFICPFEKAMKVFLSDKARGRKGGLQKTGDCIQKQAAELAGTSKCNARPYYGFCCSTCSEELLKSEFKIGGNDKVVEINDTSLAKTQKYHSFDTNKNLIVRTHIMSDLFASYVCKRDTKTHSREQPGITEWVNHSENFVEPLTGTRTNSIEGLWETRIKRYVKTMRGMLNLDEYIWQSGFFLMKARVGCFLDSLVVAILRNE